jgi:hypothetical protein
MSGYIVKARFCFYVNIVIHSELLGFRTLSIVWYSRNYKAQLFEKWICFCLHVRGGDTYSVGSFSHVLLTELDTV